MIADRAREAALAKAERNTTAGGAESVRVLFGFSCPVERRLLLRGDPDAKGSGGQSAIDWAVQMRLAEFADSLAPRSAPEDAARAFEAFGKKGIRHGQQSLNRTSSRPWLGWRKPTAPWSPKKPRKERQDFAVCMTYATGTSIWQVQRRRRSKTRPSSSTAKCRRRRSPERCKPSNYRARVFREPYAKAALSNQRGFLVWRRQRSFAVNVPDRPCR